MDSKGENMSLLWQKAARRVSDWVEAPHDEVARYARNLNAWGSPQAAPREKPWLPEDAKEITTAPVDFGVIRTLTYGRRPGTIPALATIEAISGRRARCLVEISGSVLPVELPLRLLENRGLKLGMRFLWWMSRDGSVTSQDIDDLPKNTLSYRELAEFERLSEESRLDSERGEQWIDFTGDGR
jgi:hypothetical protein